MIKINKNLALFSGLFLIIGTILLLLIQRFSPAISHAAYYCQSFITSQIISIPQYVSVIPLISIAMILGFAVIKLLASTLKIQILKKKLRRGIVKRHKIYKLIKNLNLEKRTALIKSGKKFAFCLGIRNPKIYISTGLASHLSLKEIEAVLRHEQYHLENHDTITMIIASAVRSMFPFFPLLDDLIKNYRIEREIQADLFAIKKVEDSQPLISALKKSLTFPTVSTVTLAAIADYDTLEPRIYTLLNKNYSRRRFTIKRLLITLFSLFIIGAVIVIPVNAKELHHEDHDVMIYCTDGACMNSCANEKNLQKLYTEIEGNINSGSQKSSQLYSSMQ